MRIVQLVVLFVLLTACAVSPASVPTSNQSTSADIRAPVSGFNDPLKPRLWFIDDAAEVLATVAGDPVPENLPSSPATGIVHRFTTDWIKTALRYIARDGLPPTRAARELMLVSVALNDALVVGSEAKETVDHVALLAGAVWPVLRYLHPQHSENIDRSVYEARWYGLWRREPVPAVQLERSFQIGRAVGEQVVIWAQADGSDAVREVTLPAVGAWYTDKLPLDPHWGDVKTVLIPSGDAIILPPPPDWASDRMEKERTTFLAAQQVITDEHRELAWKWHADVGTVTVPGLWFETAITMAVVGNLDELQTASLLAYLGVTMHDTAVACWHNKYLYGFVRPEQWMALVEPDWLPTVPTPPHPSYPSGHAAFSSAAANVLMIAFPKHKDMLVAQAADATRSRIIGGVHWVMDGMQGMALGRDVAQYILTH